MITLNMDFKESFDYRDNGHLEWLIFDADSIIATLELEYDWSKGLDVDSAIDNIEDSDVRICSPAYGMREYCINFFKTHKEAIETLGEDAVDPMPIPEFKQASLNAAFQLHARLMTVLSIEKSFDDDSEEYDSYGLDALEESTLECQQDSELMAYAAILKSELDRCFLNILTADNNHKAILEWKNRDLLRKLNKKGASAANDRWIEPRNIAINLAKDMWAQDKHMRITTVADAACTKIAENPEYDRDNKPIVPKITTVKKWLRVIAPEEAIKPGAPTKAQRKTSIC